MGNFLANFQIKTVLANASSAWGFTTAESYGAISDMMYMQSMNHQGLRWNVYRIANLELTKRWNLCKRGFQIYDLLIFFSCRED